MILEHRSGSISVGYHDWVKGCPIRVSYIYIYIYRSGISSTLVGYRSCIGRGLFGYRIGSVLVGYRVGYSSRIWGTSFGYWLGISSVSIGHQSRIGSASFLCHSTHAISNKRLHDSIEEMLLLSWADGISSSVVWLNLKVRSLTGSQDTGPDWISEFEVWLVLRVRGLFIDGWRCISHESITDLSFMRRYG